MASVETGSVFEATSLGSDVISVTLQHNDDAEAGAALDAPAPAVVSSSAAKVSAALDAPVTSHQASQVLCNALSRNNCFLTFHQEIVAAVALSNVSVGVQDGASSPPAESSKFSDAGVQTDFDGEKLPEGFVPYTKHRLVPLLRVAFVFLHAASGESGLYVRDVILGLNDGLVSMFLLLLGVSGGGAEATEVSASDQRYCHRLRNPGVALLLAWLFPRVVQVLLAGITGALAGAISMGLSEYIGL